MSSSTYERVKEWRMRPEAKAMRAAEARRYRAKHPETNVKAKEKYREANLEIIRERDRIAQQGQRKSDPVGYRLRQERFKAKKESKLAEIAGRPRPDICELCGKDGKTVFDHCHATGKFRGWLCDRCNRTLGQVKDNIGLLAKMITYLEGHNGKVNDEATQQAS